MSDYVTDEMVETAARAEWHVVWGDVIDWDEADPKSREMFSRGIRPALEAVVPVIAAAAIRRAIDAADEAFAQEDIAMTQWGNGYIDGQGAALGFIRNYADEMENDRG